jgi:hypothetical protein
MDLECEDVGLKKFVARPALSKATLEKAPNDAVGGSTRAAETSSLGATVLPGFFLQLQSTQLRTLVVRDDEEVLTKAIVGLACKFGHDGCLRDRSA